MKKSICLAASLLTLNLTPVFGQPGGPVISPPSTYQQRLKEIINSANSPQDQPPALAKFNLDFPGGTPKELVSAIEKAMGKPLNVIIQGEDAATQLPPVKVSDMDVGKLFKTLSQNGLKYSHTRNDEIVRNYGFTTIDTTPSDNSLWTFYSYTKPGLQTQFSLDFPGGTPAQLVKAIEKATGKRINVIINKEDENVELPPLKMDDVFLPQLFTALEVASRKLVAVSTSGMGRGDSYSQFTTSYGFKSSDDMTDTAVWYFHVEKPNLPPVVSTEKVSRFYSLTPYLDRGFTVDDITTAIQTGWKMAGETTTPELNYHKETKMLIAFGEPDELKTIDDVLRTLPQTQYSLPTLEFQIKQLQTQVDQLIRKISPSSPSGGTLEIK
jgi:hypothetical protein